MINLPNNEFNGYVIGIGASAGGLDALEKFFDACPIDTGAAFVVIQHLSPDHKSMMSNLLARHTLMPVQMVECNTMIEANHVYLIPPASIMYIGKGFLHLTPKNPRGLTLPIDIFFTALAENYGNHAIGIVLSGTGSDGTRGASAINSLGGFLLAQDPKTASFDGMPRSFINTGLVDAILPPEELATRVFAHIKYSSTTATTIDIESENSPRRLGLSNEEALNGMMELLQQISGIDFRDYKPSTIMRRIERRMQVRRIATLENYLQLLENERNEALTLRQEFLISVTSFFRDPEPFKTLAELAINKIVANKQNGETIRVWTAGTSTGEEAYSLGMLFIEEFERQKRWLILKIFATDVNQQNVDFASMGYYSESIAAELSAQRLERFFEAKSNNFVVKNELRQTIVFARHNLLTDPPFTKMDLVVCRNTLIYFKNPAQERALKRLQYAVLENGFLFLGSSESLSAANEGFKTINAKHKLFKRVHNNGGHIPLVYETLNHSTPSSNYKTDLTLSHKPRINDNNTIDSAISVLLSSYAPPALIVNQNHEILHLFGNVQPYLSLREGSASLHLGRMLSARLIPIASALLYKAAKNNSALVSDLIQFKQFDETTQTIRLSVRPIISKIHERFMLLCFEKAVQIHCETNLPEIHLASETIERIEILENELAASRESLQATIEELQSSNEELQSVNEELNTVNAEYQEKAVILSQLNADLDSMAKASGVATIFVDEKLNLTRFSQDAIQIFKLRNSDVGRRLDDFAHNLKYTQLINDIQNTLKCQSMTEREVLSQDGRTFLVRILPYSMPFARTQGAVASFIDITAFHDAQRLQAILDALYEHIAVLDRDGNILLTNQAWKQFSIYHGDSELIYSDIGSNYFQSCKNSQYKHPLLIPQAIEGIQSILQNDQPFFSLKYPFKIANQLQWFAMNVVPIHKSFNQHQCSAVVSHINISTWYQSADIEDNND